MSGYLTPEIPSEIGPDDETIVHAQAAGGVHCEISPREREDEERRHRHEFDDITDEERRELEHDTRQEVTGEE